MKAQPFLHSRFGFNKYAELFIARSWTFTLVISTLGKTRFDICDILFDFIEPTDIVFTVFFLGN